MTTVHYLKPSGERCEETHPTSDIDVTPGKGVTIREGNHLTMIPWRRVLLIERVLGI